MPYCMCDPKSPAFRMSRLAFVLVVLLAGCASGPRIDDSYKSQNVDSRVQFVVLHFTSSAFPNALKELTVGRVSSHYLVRDDPVVVYRLVPEDKRAWHAGVSSWRGQTQLNAASIGIEIVNRGNELGEWQDYPKEQIDAVLALVKDIVKRHDVRPERVVGHSDIAPQRKIDPGPKFPWKRFADEGLIPWFSDATVAARRPAFEANLPDVAWFQQMLARHGFAVPANGELDEATQRVLMVFQMKYRPARFDGLPDGETAAILDALVNP
jgi:N-acetylmuramoyl-L-alanine amidase